MRAISGKLWTLQGAPEDAPMLVHGRGTTCTVTTSIQLIWAEPRFAGRRSAWHSRITESPNLRSKVLWRMRWPP